MTAAIGKYAARKMLNTQLKKYQTKEPAGPYDPYYEYRTNPRNGKKKKYKKQIPAYIPEHDANILASVRKSAYRLDMALFTLFGMRFGWESVIGLVPGFGDVMGAFLAMQVYKQCCKVEGGLPSSVKSEMLIWIIIDAVVGIIPFVGDLLDASIKCNTHNCRLLEKHLDSKYKPKGAVDNHPGEQPAAPATVYEEMSDEDLPQYSTQPPSRGEPAMAQPQPTRVPVDTRADAAPKVVPAKKKGFFSGRGGTKSGQRNDGTVV